MAESKLRNLSVEFSKIKKWTWKKIEKWFWELFQTFGEKYPKIRCEIRKKTPYEVEKDLENGLLDFAFSFPIKSNDFGFLPCGEEELLVFLPKEHKLTSREHVSMQDLEREKILENLILN